MEGATEVAFSRLVQVAVRADGAGPLSAFLRASSSDSFRSPSQALFRSPSGAEDDGTSVSSRHPPTPSPLKGRLHSVETYLSAQFDVVSSGCPQSTVDGNRGTKDHRKSGVARTLAFGDEEATGSGTQTVDEGCEKSERSGGESAPADSHGLRVRPDVDLSRAVLLLCGAPISLVAPHIIDACGQNSFRGADDGPPPAADATASQWFDPRKSLLNDVMLPMPALRAAIQLLQRSLQPCLPMLPPAITLALRDRTLLRVVAPDLHTAVCEQVQRTAGDRLIAGASSRGGGVAAALSLGSSSLLLGLSAGPASGRALGTGSASLGGIGLGAFDAPPVAGGAAGLSLDLDVAAEEPQLRQHARRRAAAYQAADAAELSELRLLVGGAAGSAAWSGAGAGRFGNGSISGGVGGASFGSPASGRPLHGPGDISLPYSHDADSKLHLPRGDRAAQADFSRRESLRDAFLDLVRAYRDVGASFTALTREQVWAQLPVRAAAMAELLVSANVQWFARLFLHELCLFAQHDALLGSGAHGGDAAFGVAMALNGNTGGAAGAAVSGNVSGGSGGKGSATGNGSGGRGQGASGQGRAVPGAAAAHSHSQLAKMQRLSGRLGPSADQESVGTGFTKQRSRGPGNGNAVGGTTSWSNSARGGAAAAAGGGGVAGGPADVITARPAAGAWSQGAGAARKPPVQPATGPGVAFGAESATGRRDSAAGMEPVVKPRAQHGSASNAPAPALAPAAALAGSMANKGVRVLSGEGDGASFPQLPTGNSVVAAAPQGLPLIPAASASTSSAAMAAKPSPAAVASTHGFASMHVGAAAPAPAAAAALPAAAGPSGVVSPQPPSSVWGSKPSFAMAASTLSSAAPGAGRSTAAGPSSGKSIPATGKASALEARMAAAAGPSPAAPAAAAMPAVSATPAASEAPAIKPSAAPSQVQGEAPVSQPTPLAGSATAGAPTVATSSRARKRVPLAPAAGADTISAALPADGGANKTGGNGGATTTDTAQVATSSEHAAKPTKASSAVSAAAPAARGTVDVAPATAAAAAAAVPRSPASQKRLPSECFFGALLREIDSAALSSAVMHAACAAIRSLVHGPDAMASSAAVGSTTAGGGGAGILGRAVQVDVLSRLIADISCASLAEGLDSNFPADRRDAMAGCLAYRPPLPPDELINDALSSNRSVTAAEMNDGAALLLAYLAASQMLHATAAVLLQNMDDATSPGGADDAPGAVQVPECWNWWRSGTISLLKAHAQLAKSQAAAPSAITSVPAPPAAALTRLQVLLGARLDRVLSCCSDSATQILKKQATDAFGATADAMIDASQLAAADARIGSRLLLMHVESLSQASECLDVLPDLLRALLQREDAALPFAAAATSSRSRSAAASCDGDTGGEDCDGFSGAGMRSGRSSAGAGALRLRADSDGFDSRGVAASLRLPADDEAMPSTTTGTGAAAVGGGAAIARLRAVTADELLAAEHSDRGDCGDRDGRRGSGPPSPAVVHRPPVSPPPPLASGTSAPGARELSADSLLPGARAPSAPPSAGAVSLQRFPSTSAVASAAAATGTPMNSPRPSAVRGGGATSASGPGSVGGSIRKIRPVLVSLSSSADAPPPALPLPLAGAAASQAQGQGLTGSVWARSMPLEAVDETAALEAAAEVSHIPAAPASVSAEAANPAAASSPDSLVQAARSGTKASAAPDPLLSSRFQHMLTTSWLRQNPGMQPLIEAAVQAALAAASLPLAWAQPATDAAVKPAAALSESTDSPAESCSAAAATGAGSPSPAAAGAEIRPPDPIKQAQQRARIALSALLGASDAGAVAGGERAGAATHSSRDVERRAAIADVAGNVAAQLIAARMAPGARR